MTCQVLSLNVKTRLVGPVHSKRCPELNVYDLLTIKYIFLVRSSDVFDPLDSSFGVYLGLSSK